MTGILRCFVAIELPENIRLALGGGQAVARNARVNGLRWVDPAGIHLTLKFLGDTSSEQIDSISRALLEATHRQARFMLRLAQPGFFPDRINPRVCWVGLAGDMDKLISLQAQVEKSLGRLGFSPEGRKFEAHLTLVRVKDEASVSDKKRLVEKVSVTYGFTGQEFRVDAISLMQSKLLPDGARYNRLFEAPLC